MTPVALYADLLVRGVSITTADGKLRVSAPDGVLTDADRAALREHKAEFLRLMGTPVSINGEPVTPGPRVTPTAGGVAFCPNGCADELLFAVDDLLRGDLPPLPATEPERGEQAVLL